MAGSSLSQRREYRAMEECPRKRYVRYNKSIGQGTTKKVYMGFDKVDGIEIAWSKTQLTNSSNQIYKNLLAEASLLESLDHENVIKCYHSWYDDSTKIFHMITELCTSGDLRKYTNKHNLVGNTAIKNWSRQILSALNYFHDRSIPIVHRDVKIENIFIDGNLGTVKLGDYGFARKIKPGRSLTRCVGTPETMAPEILEAEYNEKADIFSFGMTLVQIVTKEKMYSECNNDKELVFGMIRRGEMPAALNNAVDSEIRQFIDKCLRPKSERPAAIDLLNDPFLVNDVPEISTAGISAASIQTLRESVRHQVARLLRKEPDKEEFDSTTDNFPASRPSLERQREMEREGETFGSQKGTSETGSPSRTHETSTDT
uniref:non-specific serine/threonine protein kinase n=2 Tax=Chenopodium quinoa TaxID=63459 RepID=A0A803MTB2_CHEQI